MSNHDGCSWTDWLWEVIDTSLYVGHVVLLLLATAAAVAIPGLLWLLLFEAREIRAAIQPACECRHRDDGPGPVLPRVLPRVRRIGEEAE